MRAAFYRGDHRFSVDEVAVAPPPGDCEVQLKVAYCGICGTDLHVYHGHMDRRVGFERVIGHEMSGTVAELGAGVSGFAVGDLVVVRPLLPCGTCPACRAGHSHICHHLNFVGLDSPGAFQERWNVPAKILHKVPQVLGAKKAALVEPVAVACHSVGRARIRAGEDVVVVGGGPIGLLVALVAREQGARVLLAEISAFRRDFAAELGFDLLPVDRGELIAAVRDRTAGKGADIVFEVTGSTAGAELVTEIAATRGRIGLVGVHAARREVDLHRFFWRELELIGSRVYLPEDFDAAIELLASGRIDGDRLITQVSPIEAINEAFASLATDPTAIKSLITL
jgi:2-desacetyl-2-hydroxyethyl bacteriochlorophyllide A dehydrogenase